MYKRPPDRPQIGTTVSVCRVTLPNSTPRRSRRSHTQLLRHDTVSSSSFFHSRLNSPHVLHLLLFVFCLVCCGGHSAARGDRGDSRWSCCDLWFPITKSTLLNLAFYQVIILYYCKALQYVQTAVAVAFIAIQWCGHLVGTTYKELLLLPCHCTGEWTSRDDDDGNDDEPGVYNKISTIAENITGLNESV